ncbi:MAG: UDP-3-O-(3-hydroxymyristoyl)glucosamine N-acyltransferase [Acidobacteria bacterium]|nr:UDP-3-O-(3-hydroxymyristoyl)glucosamine N-acyltransferase [Acidobacteriota bacterium]
MKTSEIAELVDGELCGYGDIEITSAASLEKAATGQIAFFEKVTEMPSTNASCVIIPEAALPLTTETPSHREAEARPVRSVPEMRNGERRMRNGVRRTANDQAIIGVKNPKLAFARAVNKLYASDQLFDESHPTAVIAKSADVRNAHIGAFVTIGENSYVGEGCHIHEGVRIGKNVAIRKFTVIHPNCVIYDGTEIGGNCVIHAGTIIGADGFGYVKDEEGNYEKFPQIGTVVIEDKVEIGANSCIDRGALGETRIGEGTKIDNLVQVGHNVNIGKRCVIAAQTGISGSVVIEDDCVIGGQVGFGDHVRVQSGAVIGSQAGVLPGKIVRPGIWWGTPIQPLDEYKRQSARVKGLERLREEVKALKEKIKDLAEK